MAQENWNPPQEYIEVQSKDPAIRVWAPKAIKAVEHKPQTYNCPNCGAPTKYNIAQGGVSCEHCGYTAPTQAANVGKNAKELEFRVETLQKSTENWKAEKEQLLCENCGAELFVDEKDISTTCPFCASNKVIIHKAPSDDFYPQAILPFKKNHNEIQAVFNEWLGKGWFHPKELTMTSQISKLSPVYIPAWTFDTNIDADWKALVGYERQKRYYDSSSKTWKTKTVIDWRWENGAIQQNIDDFIVIASNKLKANLFNHIKAYNLHDLMTFSQEYLVGFKAHKYTIQLTDGWEIAKNNLRESAKKACYQDIPTHHVRNFSMTADFRDETWRLILLPIYLISYKYNNEAYQVLINGQNNKLAGQKPVDWNKIWLAIAGLVSPGLLAAFISIILLVLGVPGIIGLFISGGLLLIGGLIAINIYNNAKKSEEGC